MLILWSDNLILSLIDHPHLQIALLYLGSDGIITTAALQSSLVNLSFTCGVNQSVQD